MRHLAVAAAGFDLIWSEGAAYIMGFERALTDWRRFLKAVAPCCDGVGVAAAPIRPPKRPNSFAMNTRQ